MVHAAWSTAAQAALAPFLDGGGALSEEGLVRTGRAADPMRQARETLLNGPKAEPPASITFPDKDGHERNAGRLRWWLAGATGLTWRDAFLGPPDPESLPADPVPEALLGAADPDARPVVFGHYWMHWPLGALSGRHACVDASVAMDGRLAAYRFSGERVIDPDRFVSV